MRKVFIVFFLFSFLPMISGVSSWVDQSSASSESAPALAPNPADNESLSRKLDQILKQLDEIKAELQIVKIRASQK